MIRFFMSDYGVNPPADIARIEFNLFLRHITTTLDLPDRPWSPPEWPPRGSSASGPARPGTA